MLEQLENIADVQLGLTLRGRDASRPCPGGKLQLIRIGDLTPEGRIDTPAPHLIGVSPDSVRPYLLEPGDVLVANRGQRATAALFLQDNPAVVGTQFAIIRPKRDRILNSYLHWYLNRPETQTALLAKARGTYVRSVPVTELRKLEIQVPPLRVQQQLVELEELHQTEMNLVNQINAQRQLLHHQVTNRILRQNS